MKNILHLNKIKISIIYIILLIFTLFFSSCNINLDNKKTKENKLYVYNWGLYIDDSTLKQFEKETGIDVIYDMYDTNEEMYNKIKANAIFYDILCPTDYMIEKMIKEDMLYSFDISKLSNYDYLDKDILNLMKTFDPKNQYAVPYVYSTLGIIYNKTLLNQKNLEYPESWADLFLEKYKDEIILQDAVRDVLMVGLKKNNFSMNSTNMEELKIAERDLIKQKPLIHAYLIDPARDKIANGEASIASMYSGEVEFIKSEGKKFNYEYEYILPKEGANITLDCWCIPKNANNKDNAIKWIEFMQRPDIAKINYDYMHYGVPNTKVRQMLSEDERNNEDIFPDLNRNDYEIYKDIGKFDEVYLDIWKKIKSA